MIRSTGHYQNMIIQHPSDENTYKKTRRLHQQQNTELILKFLRKYKMCFTETQWKFLNDKHHQVSNFYELHKIDKSSVIESAINTQNSEIIDILN